MRGCRLRGSSLIVLHFTIIIYSHRTVRFHIASLTSRRGRRGATSVRRYSPANEAIRIMLIRIMLTVEAITPMAGYTLNKLYVGKRVNCICFPA